jgi:hypothetical protein
LVHGRRNPAALDGQRENIQLWYPTADCRIERLWQPLLHNGRCPWAHLYEDGRLIGRWWGDAMCGQRYSNDGHRSQDYFHPDLPVTY